MNPEEFERIQSELGIVLPDSYRETMQTFPIPACAGNSDEYLWNDAESLISLNQFYRDGGHGGPEDAWPKRFYCLGNIGGGDVYAIDLNHSEAAVWWVDHAVLSLPNSGEIAPSFSEWLAKFVSDTTHDLERDGIDPQGSPEQRAEGGKRRGYGAFVIIALVLGIVALLLGYSALC